MCGLVGMISRKEFGFNHKDKQVFEQLLFTNTVRGVDSTGVFGVNKYGNLTAHKTAQAAPMAMKTQTFKDFFGKLYNDYRIVIGHNRASTRGATNDDNAHPFVEGDICLVHNGTLHSHKELADKDVDSHAICHSLATIGYKETFEKIDGAFALIWYDAAEKKLHMARNNQRPLHMAVSDDTYYFASEENMLDWILKRNGVDKYKMYYLAEDKTYSWDLDDRKIYSMKDTPAKKARPALPTTAKTYTGQVVVTNWSKTPKIKHKRAFGNKFRQNSLVLAHTVGGTDEDFGPEYKIGEQIQFYSKGATESKKKNLMLVGYTQDDNNTPVQCMLGTTNLSALALEELLDAEYLVGTIQYITYNRGVTTLQLRDPIILEDVEDEPDSIATKDGTFITKEALAKENNLCAHCASLIEYTKEDLSEAMYTPQTGEIVCKHCVKDYQKWGVLSYTPHTGGCC